jgi:hypothetical protein
VYNDVDTIFALGDFGYWEHTPHGQWALDEQSRLLQEADVQLYWLDGNHENHTLLRAIPWEMDDEGFWIIRENIKYSPRGHDWTWGETHFLTLGGAYSIDKNKRRPGTSWWSEETITDEDVEACYTPERVDIMLTHDLPTGIDMQAIQAYRGFPYQTIPASEDNRNKVRQVVEGCLPTKLFHGHYHLKYEDLLTLENGWEVQVMGLGCDEMGRDSYHILEYD